MNSRYSRQILFSPIGVQGQEKLQQKHVLIIGAGALGSGSAEMLTRAGVGRITIIDRDYVDWSNLQRQQLYAEQDVEEHLPKAIAAQKRLHAINKEIEVIAHIQDVTALELEQLVHDVDLLIDATDNFETRFLINDVAQKYNIPWIYGACVGSYGLTYTILPGETPCLSCLLESIPLGIATCDTAGIISPAVSMVVSHQVTEALKILTDNKDSLQKRLISFDVWQNEYSTMNVQPLKKPRCPSCGEGAVYPYLQQENQTKTTVLCGRDTVQIRMPFSGEIRTEEHAKLLENKVEQLFVNPYLLSFTADDKRLVLFRDGRVLVHGTKHVAEAKSLYHRYFG
ncbi:thiazole biosynthesis adenylyltransferase ThiF [Ectobacillus funiculus]|uniref:thiazole biosynthesis adenylyltransferase ThiF n=1 Tax=Ectobacillus funiculus TaxID=137993 RepID=UPI00101D9EB3|nr:thiazole biosynthesis adenylyltransferase ThiF [Ectobacillus funiculus]